MPQGKGTYGKKRGRPPKKSATKKVAKRLGKLAGKKRKKKKSGNLPLLKNQTPGRKTSRGTLKGKSKSRSKWIMKELDDSHTRSVYKRKAGKTVQKEKTISAAKANRLGKRYTKTQTRRMKSVSKKRNKKN